MTRYKSFKYAIELWEWLIDNPDKEKWQHPTLPVIMWEASCSFCQVDTDHCEECPMQYHWPSSEGPVVSCHDSAFRQWASQSEPILAYDRSFLAAVLVEAFKERLSIEIIDGVYKWKSTF